MYPSLDFLDGVLCLSESEPGLKWLQCVLCEFIGPGLHLRPVRADRARLPLQWTLNSLLISTELRWWVWTRTHGVGGGFGHVHMGYKRFSQMLDGVLVSITLMLSVTRKEKLNNKQNSEDKNYFGVLNTRLHSVLSRRFIQRIKMFYCLNLILNRNITFSCLHGSSGKLTGSTSSLNKLSVQSSGNRRSQSSSLLDMGNMSASDLNVADRARFDKIFEQVLSELEPLCLAEQDFISKFFKLQRHQSMPGTVTEAEDTDGRTLSWQHNAGTPLPVSSEKDMIRQMMIKIFRCIEPELNNLIALGDKIDSFNSLDMLVKMSRHVWTAQNVDPASFLSTTLGNVLVTVKRNFDKYISNQIRQMEEVKISKKSKVGILPFVAEFEEFAGLAESIFKNAECRGDLDKAYTKLIRGVFVNVEKVANESQKTPRDVLMMENFHHIFATLSRLKISCLEADKNRSQTKIHRSPSSRYIYIKKQYVSYIKDLPIYMLKNQLHFKGNLRRIFITAQQSVC
ncbi:hypothetical protein FD754_023638 [Muntiacus muntjak]|uniref:Exocyst complex component Sec3 C-terminal domain-containing protein n=1 Tax=Muntiacus muntjak TaxID=9888 RepID=A0A5N3USY9_MUNMU|nr:hypothetical protein FD754_023638 [Muntiacus muntjak]